jgi:hypothetical protein
MGFAGVYPVGLLANGRARPKKIFPDLVMSSGSFLPCGSTGMETSNSIRITHVVANLVQILASATPLSSSCYEVPVFLAQGLVL